MILTIIETININTLNAIGHQVILFPLFPHGFLGLTRSQSPIIGLCDHHRDSLSQSHHHRASSLSRLIIHKPHHPQKSFQASLLLSLTTHETPSLSPTIHETHHPRASSPPRLTISEVHHPRDSSSLSLINKNHQHQATSPTRLIITEPHHPQDSSSSSPIINKAHHHRASSSTRLTITETHHT
jgi:hypothetical protein